MAGCKAVAAMCLLLLVVAAMPSSSSSSKDEIMDLCRFYLGAKLGDPYPKPDSACCQKVKEASVSDICNEFTDEDKEKITLYKWARVCRECGNPLQSGSECSGYHVP
jgi:Probable lipid transfer